MNRNCSQRWVPGGSDCVFITVVFPKPSVASIELIHSSYWEEERREGGIRREEERERGIEGGKEEGRRGREKSYTRASVEKCVEAKVTAFGKVNESEREVPEAPPSEASGSLKVMMDSLRPRSPRVRSSRT